MEEIAHGVYKNELRLLPLERRFQDVLMQSQLEAVSVIGLPHCAQPECHPLGITVLATRTDFSAAGYRVPRRSGPLNARFCHQTIL